MTLSIRTRVLLVPLLCLAACGEGAGDAPGPGLDAADGDDLASGADVGVDDVDAGGSDAGEPDATPVPDAAEDVLPDGAPDATDVADVATAIDPGFKLIHRLNRAEYNNTVRDLLATSLRPADDFPADDVSLGYDNIADALHMSPLYLELAVRAAEQLVDEALRIPRAPRSVRVFEAEETPATTGGGTAEGWNLWSNGRLYTTIELALGGTYEMRAIAAPQPAGDEAPRMAFLLDGTTVATFDVEGARGAYQLFEARIDIAAGAHEIAVAFTNDFYDAGASLDRNLLVDQFVVDGPIDAILGVNPAREALLTCTPDAGAWQACARQILEPFVRRAWRRPATDEELERLGLLVERALAIDTPFDTAIGVALQAVLASPHFLFRVEVDPDPLAAEPRALDGWELATRLSYFLWSSGPDDELLDRAADGTLVDDRELERQVARLLADPRSIALVHNFAGQWLYIRNVDSTSPSRDIFPSFDDGLRASMRAEMEHFFESFLREPRSMTELLTADDTFVDARLAAHYGAEGPAEGFARMTIPGRGGILRQAGFLTASSYPTRTSPVRRGKFILGQLLCSEPDPPPADAGGLAEDEELAGLSLRERMELHRRDPSCANCHSAMDPLGFGLERYDAIGQLRDSYPDGPIDDSGVLPDGTTFHGAQELAQILADNRAFTDCVARQLFTYALGRAPLDADAPALREIVARFGESGWRLDALVLAIAQSEPFRMRRSDVGVE
jgi:hypothetical protein